MHAAARLVAPVLAHEQVIGTRGSSSEAPTDQLAFSWWTDATSHFALPYLDYPTGARERLTPAEIKARMVEQVTASVRWEESMRALLAQGYTRFIELGPGAWGAATKDQGQTTRDALSNGWAGGPGRHAAVRPFTRHAARGWNMPRPMLASTMSV